MMRIKPSRIICAKPDQRPTLADDEVYEKEDARSLEEKSRIVDRRSGRSDH